MRHGWQWWETFWSWLLSEAKGHIINDRWLRDKYRQFSELWRTGKVKYPFTG